MVKDGGSKSTCSVVKDGGSRSTCSVVMMKALRTDGGWSQGHLQYVDRLKTSERVLTQWNSKEKELVLASW